VEAVPVLDRPGILWTALVYLAVVIAIGAWSLRRTRDAKDFFIAGQSLGLLVAGMATMSAAFSGFVFIGGPGLVQRMGVAALFICVPVGFTSGLLAWVVGKRLRLLAETRPVYTIPDALQARYGSRRVAGLGACAVLLGTIAYLGAQLLALGVVIEAVFGTRELLGEASLPVAVGVGVLVIVLYATAGGMVAGVYTDLFQGLLMILAAGGVFFYALRAGGGVGQIARTVAESPEYGASFLDPLGNVPVLTALGFFFLFGVGTLGQPQMLHKFFMIERVGTLKWMPAVIGGGQTICVLLWIGIGLAVPALLATGQMSPLANADDATPRFLLEATPELLAGLVFAGILAAIMSTADSFLNIGAAALVRDLPAALGRRRPNQLAAGRIAVVAIALAAALLALVYGDLIALLGTFAFGTFAAALTPAVAIGLNWQRVTAGAAGASILVGLVANVGLELWSRQTWLLSLPPLLPPGALPGVVAVGASLSVLLIWSWLTDPPPLDADVERILDL
jgi:Na+/proline symporter